VVHLLQAMGYGDGSSEAGLALGRSGDGGVDGVIREDRLGLDLIYVQAKRYTDQAVPPAQVQAFAGALNMQRATKGVFITTSRFTDAARQAAAQLHGMRIVLIDGEELTRLMLNHDVGVRAEQHIVLKRLDLDFFEPEDVL
jgi:restriction system protein